MWKKGELRELFSECAEIQKRLKKSKRKEENASRGFVRLMMEGRVRQALKLVNADTDICGVHEMSSKNITRETSCSRGSSRGSAGQLRYQKGRKCHIRRH